MRPSSRARLALAGPPRRRTTGVCSRPSNRILPGIGRLTDIRPVCAWGLPCARPPAVVVMFRPREGGGFPPGLAWTRGGEGGRVNLCDEDARRAAEVLGRHGLVSLTPL